MGASIQTCASASAFSLNLVIFILVLAFAIQYAIPLTPACSAPFHECVRYTRPPVFFVRPILLPSTRHLPMNRCSHPALSAVGTMFYTDLEFLLSNSNSDIVLSIVDPLGLPFQPSPLCVSPCCNVTSIPASKSCRRRFAASISLIIRRNVLLYSIWTSLLLGHRRM